MIKKLLAFLMIPLTVGAAQTSVQIKGGVVITGNVTLGVGTNVVAGANYYIAPSTGSFGGCSANGSDSNNGTSKSTPFATIAHAKSVLRSSGLLGVQPLVVQVCGGIYYGTNLTGTNAFTSSDSGTLANPVIWENYPGDSPILSGGVQLNKLFTLNSSSSSFCAGVSNCFTATLSSAYATTDYFERAWYCSAINVCGPRFRPRLGVTGTSSLVGNYGHITNASPTARQASFTYGASDPGMSGAASWTNKADIEVLDEERWVWNLNKFSSVNTSSHTLTTACSLSLNAGNGGCEGSCSSGTCYPGVFRQGNMYLIENVPQGFGTAGQWYLDRITSPSVPVLYYAANSGELPNSDVGLIVGQSPRVMDVNGTTYVTFQGLQFQNDNYNVPTGGYTSVQLDPYVNYAGTNTANLPSAMVSCTGCMHVTFNLDSFTQTTLNGIEFINGAAFDTLENSALWDIGGYGAKAGNAINSGTAPNQIFIENNTFRGIGHFLATGDAIGIGVAANVDVGFNDISYTAHDAVEVCKPGVSQPGYCNGVLGITIHDNYMYMIMEGLTSDGGCVYTMTAQTPASGSSAVTITHNSCSDVDDSRAQYLNYASYSGDGYGGNCFYHDQYSGLATDTMNLCYRATGTGFKNTNGPQVTGQPSIATNNIYAYIMSSIGGVQKCTPSASVQQFQFTHNQILMDKYPGQSNAWDGANDYQIQYGVPPATGGTYTGIQLWQANYYFLTTSGGYCNSAPCTGTQSPSFNKASNASCNQTGLTDFASWQALPEDAASSVLTNPNFNAPVGCTPGTDPNWPKPYFNHCDDFTQASAPSGFTTFPLTAATSNTPGNGFGNYPVAGAPTVPSVVPDMFLTAFFSATAF